MLDRTLDQLRTWVQNAVDVDTVSLDPPGPADGATVVSCYFYAIGENPPMRSARNAPLQLACYVLVSCTAPTALESSRILSELIFATMQNPDYEIVLEPPPAEFWLALGVIPRPCYALRIPLRIERPSAAVPRVRQPLSVEGAPITQLNGVVLGPGDIPIAGARVEVPMLQRTTRTDANGRFRLTGMAAEPRAKQLRVSAKGETLDVTVMQPAVATEVIVVHFDKFT
jgi:hypothetical protein